jgi:hypothetical protein
MPPTDFLGPRPGLLLAQDRDDLFLADAHPVSVSL